jgi:hypothetical protein
VVLFDPIEEHPRSKTRRRIIIGFCVLILGAGVLWWLLRFHTERVTIHNFLNAVVAGNMQKAYQIWKPEQSYSFKDFLDDWGPNGYYGPVKSFQVKDSERPKQGSAVAVKIELSPYQPFPEDDDRLKQNRTKEVILWIELKDQSISFPPY